MLNKKFKLGYAPTRRATFSREEAVRYRELTLEKVKSFGVEVVDIDWLNEDGLLFDIQQVGDIVKKFRHELKSSISTGLMKMVCSSIYNRSAI